VVDFDLDTYLDAAGVFCSGKGTSAEGIVYEPATAKFKFTDKTFVAKAEKEHASKRWFDKALYKPGTLLKTMTAFPLCFETNTNNALWKNSVDFEKKYFTLFKDQIVTVLDEGIVKVGKIWAERGGLQHLRTYNRTSTSMHYSSYKNNPIFEMRFVHVLSAGKTAGKSAARRDPSGSVPKEFYILFDREVGRIYCDATVFEVLVEGKLRRKKLGVYDYSDVVKVKEPKWKW